MRLNLYLTENEEQDMKLIEEFHKNTTQWFKEMNGQRTWRATNKLITGLNIYKTRKERLPKDTPQDVSEYFDNEFKKKWGWKARSQSVFTSTNPNGLEQFGSDAYLFYPINGYSYLWSPTISDMTAYLEDKDVIMTYTGKKWFRSDNWNDKDELKRISDAMMKNYTNKNLKKASYYTTEVMFNCPKGYYMVGKHFWDKYHKELLGDNL